VAPPAPSDVDPPLIADVAAAASNPMAAPVVTVMISDRGSGVGEATVFFRAPAGAWQKAPLAGGTTGMFIARLPEGLQTTGFDYYVEATDVSGNGPARIASPEQPIRVPGATEEPTLVRVERQKQDAQTAAAPRAQIHPGWMMLSLGVGVLAGAGAGAYGLDLVQTQRRLDDNDEQLADNALSDARRQVLTETKVGLQEAAVQDTIITSILGVVAVAGVVTGAVLVVVSAAE
jgi:hypothetical protein